MGKNLRLLHSIREARQVSAVIFQRRAVPRDVCLTQVADKYQEPLAPRGLALMEWQWDKSAMTEQIVLLQTVEIADMAQEEMLAYGTFLYYEKTERIQTW